MRLRLVGPASAQEVTGGDTVILTLPSEYLMLLDLPVEEIAGSSFIGDLSRYLLDLAASQAEAMGEALHSADYRITVDPATVGRHGLMHEDCEDCQRGVLSALDGLVAEPECPVLVGRLYWAKP